MFNKEKSNSTEKSTGNSATLISAGTVLKGDVQSDNDLRIDGTIHGHVTSSAKIVVGPTGFVEGNIQGSQADVTGKVVGNINVKELAQLRTKSNVQGNITAASLQIESGAVFNGQSVMTVSTNVVQMNEGEVLHAKAK
ncbi:MAG TPA: polymer-forming cytoskeletal protein [Flavisolibacter sp.]|jgi:cytoskeletal protein CcmA (bactofilin family)|nr:polymer-forming cytoskeletal protein [Flavisolibacter sp.]